MKERNRRRAWRRLERDAKKRHKRSWGAHDRYWNWVFVPCPYLVTGVAVFIDVEPMGLFDGVEQRVVVKLPEEA